MLQEIISWKKSHLLAQFTIQHRLGLGSSVACVIMAAKAASYPALEIKGMLCLLSNIRSAMECVYVSHVKKKKKKGRGEKKRESEVTVLLEKCQDSIGNIPLNHKFVGEKTKPLDFLNYAYARLKKMYTI